MGITVYHDFGRSLKHYVTSFLLARYDGVFWVISLLFVMTLFSQINYKIIKNFPLTVIAFCVISILYYVNWNGLFRIFGSFEVRIVRDIYYAAVYELAAATALKYPHAAGKIYSAKQKMVVSFLTAISLFGFWHRIFDMIWIILWPVFVWVSVEKRAGDRKHFISLREQSFFILASHLFVIYYLHKILDFCGITGVSSFMASNVARIVFGTVTNTICLLLGIFLQKYCAGFFRLITGRRRAEYGTES